MWSLLFEQTLNGLQFGVMLFLMAAGLTLVFGIMNFINLAHGSLYMVGAYLAVAATKWTGSYLLGVALGLAGTLVAALGVNIRLLYTVVFGFGAALAGLAGLLAGPIYNVQPGMGELILIQVFVVIVIGGIGSIRGALVGAVIVGVVDTLGRAFLKPLLGTLISPPAAESAGPALASMLIYLLMAVVLAFRPQGLFPARGS